MSVVTIPAINCGEKEAFTLLTTSERKWRLRNTHTQALFYCVSCLRLHSHIPFPASVCSMNSEPTPRWVLEVGGRRGTMGAPLGCSGGEKKHTAAGVLPRLRHWFYTVVLFSSRWLIQWQATKAPLLFFLFSSTWWCFFLFFILPLKSTNQWGENDLWHHLFFVPSLCVCET